MNNLTISSRMAELAFKKVTSNLSEEEAIELRSIIESSPEKKELYDELMNPEIMAEQIVLMSEFDVNASWQKVKERYPFLDRKPILRDYLIAAIVILAVCVIVYLYVK